MPVLMKHYVMLQRNLIYTGITRAKKICVLIGSTRALAYAIHHLTVSSRNTRLKERLRGESRQTAGIIPLHESKPYEFPEETDYPMVAESEIEYQV